MGPTGSGKTTLLDTLAGKVAGDRVTSRLPKERIDGREAGSVGRDGVAAMGLVDGHLALVAHIKPALLRVHIRLGRHP